MQPWKSSQLDFLLLIEHCAHETIENLAASDWRCWSSIYWSGLTLMCGVWWPFDISKNGAWNFCLVIANKVSLVIWTCYSWCSWTQIWVRRMARVGELRMHPTKTILLTHFHASEEMYHGLLTVRDVSFHHHAIEKVWSCRTWSCSSPQDQREEDRLDGSGFFHLPQELVQSKHPGRNRFYTNWGKVSKVKSTLSSLIRARS